MKKTIDEQIELSLKYTDKLKSLKHCNALLRSTPVSTELLSLQLQLKDEAADLIIEMVGSYLPKIYKAGQDNAVTMATEYFENN